MKRSNYKNALTSVCFHTSISVVPNVLIWATFIFLEGFRGHKEIF